MCSLSACISSGDQHPGPTSTEGRASLEGQLKLLTIARLQLVQVHDAPSPGFISRRLHGCAEGQEMLWADLARPEGEISTG